MIIRLTYLFGISILCHLCLSCSSPPNLGIYHTDTEWVDLREWPIGYHQPTPNAHPYSISPQVLDHILRSTYYRESTIFSFVMSRLRPVFTEEQIYLLSHAFSKAFDQALPQEVVAFRVKKKGDSSRYTKGLCFIRENELHLIIEDLRLPDFKSQETIPQPNTAKWEFHPRNGQSLYTSHPDGKGENPHWLVIRLDRKKFGHG